MSKLTYFYEDFSAKDLDESVVGRKAMSLFQLKDIDVPVPPFFALSPLVFDDLIYRAFGEEIEKYLKQKKIPDPIDVEKLLHQTDFSSEVEEELFKLYAKLSGFNDAWVAVRSSVVYLPNQKVLFSGVFATEVNARGFEELVKAIKKVYSSTFQDCVVSYAKKHSLDLSQLRMAVVIQKMVQAEVSGVTYTKDLITQDETKLSIEAVFGLGDVITSGEITPDRYVLNKKDLSFEEKKVSPQEWMHIRMLNTKGQGGVERINISSSWSHQQKLEDRFLKEIAKVCLLIEDSFGKSQNIEWVWESGKVWIIQNKFVYVPQAKNLQEQNYSNVILNPVLNVVKQKKEEEIRKRSEEEKCEDRVCEVEKKEKVKKEMADLDEKIAKLSSKFEDFAKKKLVQEEKEIRKMTEEIAQEREGITEDISKNLIKDNLNVKNFKFVASGSGLSAGSKIGRVVYVNSKNCKQLVISKENIIILQKVFPGVENILSRSGGVLVESGSISSNLSALCRQFGVPAISGISNLSKLLKEGSFVKIDANAGSVYVYFEEEKKESLNYEVVKDVSKEKKDTKKTEEKVFKEDVVVLPEIPKTATEVYLSSKGISNVEKFVLENSNGLAFLDIESLMLNEGRHPLAFVEEGQVVEYTSLLAKKIDSLADKLAGNELIVSLGNHYSQSFSELTKGKSFEKGDLSRGLSRYLQNPEFAKIALKIVSKSRNVFRNKNISLAFHSPLAGDNLVAIKKKIVSFKLRRNSTFKLYAIIENPSEIILIEDILSANIDGIIINTPALARQMQGLSLFDEKAVYSLETNSLFKTLETIYEKVKHTKIKTLGITENNQNLLKKFIELGICGVVVDASEFANSKKIISEKETEIILSKSRF